MAKTRPPYTPEFRRQLVELVRAGRLPEELSREFEPTAQSIRNWVAQAERDGGSGDGGLTTTEPEELSAGRVLQTGGAARSAIRCGLLAGRRIGPSGVQGGHHEAARIHHATGRRGRWRRAVR
jgi:transposase